MGISFFCAEKGDWRTDKGKALTRLKPYKMILNSREKV